MKNRLFLAALFFVFSSQAAAFDLSGLDAPESVQVDPETGTYYVTNVHGELREKDGNGYITKAPASGNAVIRKFIGGKTDQPLLHAPKGLAVKGPRIYVTDIDAIKVFDKDSGKQLSIIDLSSWKARSLNDLVIDGETLYASDVLSDRIFKVDLAKDGEVSVHLEDERLDGPNGLMINPRNRKLMAVTWEGGRILEIDPSGRIHVLKRGLTALDGIDHDADGNLYVSSFEKGEVYRIPMYGRGALSTFLSGLDSPADVSCDRAKRELIIPSMKGGGLRTYPLTKAEA